MAGHGGPPHQLLEALRAGRKLYLVRGAEAHPTIVGGAARGLPVLGSVFATPCSLLRPRSGPAPLAQRACSYKHFFGSIPYASIFLYRDGLGIDRSLAAAVT